MLTRLADLGIRYPKRVLTIAGLLLIVGVIYGGQAASQPAIEALVGRTGVVGGR